MARQKLSEYRAKTLLYEALGLPYSGISIDAETELMHQLEALDPQGKYVVKVDQGIKSRFKKGLVKLDRTPTELPTDIGELGAKGYRWLIIEPYATHADSDERYFALELERLGTIVSVSNSGGVDIEARPETLRRKLYSPETAAGFDTDLGLPTGTIEAIYKVFNDTYMSFLEINPLIVQGSTVNLLDAAALVDEEAATLVGSAWTSTDLRTTGHKTPQEAAVSELAATSQASFRLEVLNPNGQIFLLLSGGGASVVVADEVANLGLGKQLGNYGEYSGNPLAEEAYLYAKQILSLLLDSSASAKTLIIGGGVANFTDIRVTFRGLIQALDEVKDQLRDQHVKVFVRRGGPHEAEGLASMRSFLETTGLLGQVSGPELTLTDIVAPAIASLKNQSAGDVA